jgi:hypothetical protein
MSSLTVTRSNLQLVGSKARFLELVKKNNEYCPVCDGFGFTEYNFGDDLIRSNCHYCVDVSMGVLG